MHQRLIASALIVAAGSFLVTGFAPPAHAGTRAQAGRGGQVLVKSQADEVLPVHGGTVDSLNWSGYAVTPATDGITAVASTFVVPAAAAAPPGFAATWTGIGGYSSSDLIQAGVSENSSSTGVTGSQYGAWYELLPKSETPLKACKGKKSCPVEPGDNVSVSITEVSANQWSIHLADSTEGWTWSKTVKSRVDRVVSRVDPRGADGRGADDPGQCGHRSFRTHLDLHRRWADLHHRGG